jgi:2-keto-4-pentenoate hydratase
MNNFPRAFYASNHAFQGLLSERLGWRPSLLSRPQAPGGVHKIPGQSLERGRVARSLGMGQSMEWGKGGHVATTGREQQLAEEVLAQLDLGKTIDPLASSFAHLNLEEAYRVQLALIDRRCARGERIVGRKVAFTSRGTMTQFGVTESAFGTILSGGVFADGDAVPVSRFPAVGAEAEVAFVIGEELRGPGVTIAQVLKATRGVVAALEIINLCITRTPWNPVEVVATNAVHGGIVLGGQLTPLDGLNLRYEGMVAEVDGEPVGSGAGVEVLGNPAASVAWLANKLSEFDRTLRPDDIVLSGSIIRMLEVKAGQAVKATFSRIGSVGARFV